MSGNHALLCQPSHSVGRIPDIVADYPEEILFQYINLNHVHFPHESTLLGIMDRDVSFFLGLWFRIRTPKHLARPFSRSLVHPVIPKVS